MKLKHQSIYGTIALILSLLFLSFIIIRLFFGSQIYTLLWALWPPENIRWLFGFLDTIFFIIIPVLILIFGILGLFKKDSKKGFAIAGLTIEGVILLATLLLLTYIYITQGSLGF